MDIHSTLKQLHKIVKFATEYNDNNTRPYPQVEANWLEARDLVTTLLPTLDAIADKIAGKYGECVVDEVLQEDAVSQKLELVKPSKPSKPSKPLEPLSENKPQKIMETSKLVAKPNNQSAIAKDARRKAGKYMSHKFGTVLESIANSEHAYVSVNTCSKLLWEWWRKKVYTKSFYFKSSDISSYLATIVIAYGSAYEQGNGAEFKDEFCAWLDTDSSDAGAKYGLSYSLNQVRKHMLPRHVSVTAAVLWDRLLYAGLDELTKIGESEICLNPNIVMEMMDKADNGRVSMLADYQHFTDNRSMLNYL